MTRKCPKCAYVREAKDHAPEWQCPSCGIAYDKYKPPQGESGPGGLRDIRPSDVSARGGGGGARFFLLLAASLAVGYFGGWDYSKQWLQTTFGDPQTRSEAEAASAVLELLAFECRQRTDLPLVEAVGTVRSLADRNLNVFVNVELHSDNGQLIDMGQGLLERTPLSAHSTSDFKVLVRDAATADRCAVRFFDPGRHELIHTDSTEPA
jgi:rubredoxin